MIRHTSDGELVARFQLRSGSVFAAACSPDLVAGVHSPLAALGCNKRALLFDLATNAHTAIFTGKLLAYNVTFDCSLSQTRVTCSRKRSFPLASCCSAVVAVVSCAAD